MSEINDDDWARRIFRGDGTLGAGAGWADARARLDERVAAEAAFDVAFESHDSPYGALLIGATPVGVVRVGLPAEDETAVLGQVAAKVSARVWRVSTAIIADTRRQLDEYFAGGRRAFDVPLDWSLTGAFRRQVLEATARIPYGGTVSYGQLADAAGSPRAVRAAGTALATNPLPIIVPCHRVLRSDGTIGQYLGGAPMKAALLGLEASA